MCFSSPVFFHADAATAALGVLTVLTSWAAVGGAVAAAIAVTAAAAFCIFTATAVGSTPTSLSTSLTTLTRAAALATLGTTTALATARRQCLAGGFAFLLVEFAVAILVVFLHQAGAVVGPAAAAAVAVACGATSRLALAHSLPQRGHAFPALFLRDFVGFHRFTDLPASRLQSPADARIAGATVTGPVALTFAQLPTGGSCSSSFLLAQFAVAVLVESLDDTFA